MSYYGIVGSGGWAHFFRPLGNGNLPVTHHFHARFSSANPPNNLESISSTSKYWFFTAILPGFAGRWYRTMKARAGAMRLAQGAEREQERWDNILCFFSVDNILLIFWFNTYELLDINRILFFIYKNIYIDIPWLEKWLKKCSGVLFVPLF